LKCDPVPLTQASRLALGTPGDNAWQQKKEAYVNAGKYFTMASQSLPGFASPDARVFSRLAESYERQAQMDALELAFTAPDRRDSLTAERDRLLGESEESMRRAREMLVAAELRPPMPTIEW
jgi:hypothetical protein